MRKITWCAVIWAILLILLFVFSTPLGEALWIAYLPVHFLPVVLGVPLLIASVVTGCKRKWYRVLPALLIAGTGLTLFFTSGFRLGRKAYFQIQKPSYERMLAEAVRTGAVPWTDGHIDKGPPVRYAFYFQRGMVDNWVGAVYDPSGEVMRVNEAKGWEELRSPALADVVGLFLGDIYQAESMGGGWYLCWFT